MTSGKTESADYHIGVHTDWAELPPHEWDALLAQQAAPTPFMRHAFLQALQHSGCATARTGWTLAALTVHHDGALQGAVPAYLKTHSRGEYVFDHAWAEAYERHGLRYYPKLLSAVPFTPVPGSRLLAADERACRVLLDALRALATQQGLSSAHLLFLDATEQEAARQAGWMLRHSVQFHWHNRAGQPWTDLTDYLSSLQRDKRKKIQQERRRVHDAGIRFRVLEGAEIREADWDFFHHVYTLTYAAHYSQPYLNRAFFAEVAQTMAPHWLMFVAERGSEPVAASLLAIDRAQGAAWGRHWGCTETIDCLHFEACYYQPLAWCMAQGFQRFEGGAQGEHKMARGLMPVETASAHWLAHPQFAAAVEDFLAREGAGVEGYLDELRERTPFKAGADAKNPAEASPGPG